MSTIVGVRCCTPLDAAFAHVYGIARDDIDYIMATSPILVQDGATSLADRCNRTIICNGTIH